MTEAIWDGTEKRESDEERRKICFLHKEAIDKIKSDIKDNQSDIHRIETISLPILFNFRGQAKIIGVIALAIWGLGFAYTHNHKVESVANINRLHDRINLNVSDLSNLKGDQKALIVEVKNLVKEVEKSNILTGKFLAVLLDERAKTKRQFYEE